jgi:hypothetical protein
VKAYRQLAENNERAAQAAGEARWRADEALHDQRAIATTAQK